MAAAEDQLIGGRYRLESIVGKGGGGEVWRARDVALERVVAVKLLRLWNDEEKARVWREARLAALLGSSGAVPIYDFGDDGTNCFLVMELVHDPTLRKLMADPEVMRLPALLRISRLLMEAVAQAHELSIVHRDVKPENIFVAGDLPSVTGIRLVDFGMAFLSDQSADSKEGLGRITEEDGVSGTPAYLSPEQARRDEIGKESDVYSAGCVLYEVCAGVPPFTGSLAELLSKHMYVPPIPLRERTPETPEAFSDLINLMLGKDPGDRPSAAEAVAALAQLEEDLDSGSPRLLRSGSDKLREDRMVDTRASTESVAQGELRVAVASACPGWLTERLSEARLTLVEDIDEAQLLFSRYSTAAEPSRSVPTIAWTDGEESLDIAALIRRGFAAVISQDTLPIQVHQLAYKLEKKARRS